jgi:hypothetical protein
MFAFLPGSFSSRFARTSVLALAVALPACGDALPERSGDAGFSWPSYDAGWQPPADGNLNPYDPDGTDPVTGDGWSADGASGDGRDPDDLADGSDTDGSDADGAAEDGGVGGIDWDDIFPPPPDGGTPTTSGDLKPLPDNVPECPPTAPENPVGLCIGVPIYAFCGYTDGVNNYNCICDWYHWLCSPL